MILKKNTIVRQVWKILKHCSDFWDNEKVKAIKLYNELYNIVIGDSMISYYYIEIKTIIGLLDDNDVTVS